METQKTKMEMLLNKAANVMMDSDTWDWPPKCSYFFYQPSRPQQMKRDHKGIDQELEDNKS